MEETKYSHLAGELGGPDQHQQHQDQRGVPVMTDDPDGLSSGVVVNLQMEVGRKSINVIFCLFFFLLIIHSPI